MAKEDKTRITLTIETELKARAAASAQWDRRDLSAQICVLIREALDARKTTKARA